MIDSGPAWPIALPLPHFLGFFVFFYFSLFFPLILLLSRHRHPGQFFFFVFLFLSPVHGFRPFLVLRKIAAQNAPTHQAIWLVETQVPFREGIA